MKQILIPAFVGILCTSFTINPPSREIDHPREIRTGIKEKASIPSFNEKEASDLYQACNLQQYGLSETAFQYAFKGYQDLLQKQKIARPGYLAICDFSQPSGKKRLYIIDMIENQLLIHTYVAHGRNSGAEYATRFSNTPESLQSSLGFYVTQSTYIGEHGLSLRLIGLEPGYNDKAFERSIVIHGAAYVDDARARQGIFMGRSFGCPAVPQKESAEIINTIKNGCCLFIYHPDRNYLVHSKILNG